MRYLYLNIFDLRPKSEVQQSFQIITPTICVVIYFTQVNHPACWCCQKCSSTSKIWRQIIIYYNNRRLDSGLDFYQITAISVHICSFIPQTDHICIWGRPLLKLSDSCSSCFFTCLLQLLSSEKAFSQNGHSYGFSPVWVRECRFRSDDLLKVFAQISHP